VILQSVLPVAVAGQGFETARILRGFFNTLSAQAGAKHNTSNHTPCVGLSHNGGRLSEQEIVAKSREHGLPE